VVAHRISDAEILRGICSFTLRALHVSTICALNPEDPVRKGN
jgi:hypothetical protein